MKYIKAYEQANVTKLDLSNLGLTELPELPDTLEVLRCSFNRLTSLPDLPNTLEALNCSNNQLTSLPELPYKLKELFCSGNKLTSLPELPNTLETLLCYGNQLPYNNLEEYWKWFKETYPEEWELRQNLTKYNL